MKQNTTAMIEFNINKKQKNTERVISAIEQCKVEGNISTKRVCELAGVDKSYFSRHPELRKVLNTAKGIVNRNTKKTKQNNNSRDVLERSLYAENTKLKKEIAKLQEYKKYKDMYEEKCIEIEKLEMQLNEAYHSSGILNF